MKRFLSLVLIAAWGSILESKAFAESVIGNDSIISDRKHISIAEFDYRGAHSFSSFKDDVLEKQLDSSEAKNSFYSSMLNFKYGFLYSSASKVGELFPDVKQGVGVGATAFSHPATIGVPVSIYLFQGAPIVKFNEKLSLNYEWNFGLSAGWKPSDGYTAASNLIVGSKVNAYIDLGIALRWKIAKNYHLSTGLNLTHYSNGNTSFPNPGVNLAGARIGISRIFGSEQNRQTPFKNEASSFKRGLSYDVTGYGAWRRRVYRGGEEPILLAGHFPVAGLSFSPMYDLRRWLRVGGSADFQYDHSTDLKRHHISGATPDDIIFSRVPFFSQVCGGLAMRAELSMPIFSVNVGIGYNIIGPEEARASYQMANLKIYITPGLYLNIGYQLLNFQKQNNLMLGLGYTFKSRREEEAVLIGFF